jgi:hypothetical protein
MIVGMNQLASARVPNQIFAAFAKRATKELQNSLFQ